MDKQYLENIGIGKNDCDTNRLKESILKVYNEENPEHALTIAEFEAAVKLAKTMILWEFEQKQKFPHPSGHSRT